MKATLKITALTLALMLAASAALMAQGSAPAEQQQPQEKEARGGLMGKIFGQGAKTRNGQQEKGAPRKSSPKSNERLEPDDANTLPADVSAEVQAGRRESNSEAEAAVLPYYNNFLTTYRLGPEDVISVSVFNQDRYSRSGITVPPDGRISYPLIPEGISVAGKTTQQLQEEITKRFDEYIIEPKVTVSLDKAVSAIYSVVGDVAQPGVRTMTRRYSITEALAMAGGVLNTGDKSKVVILRQQADGNVRPIFVNVKNIERGRAKEMAFLVPGDQVVVPGNSLKKWKQVMDLLPVISFAKIFTGGW
ncbi:MAG TPA: polysaccharide biosynthesis/export family protein [Pyrinomonadaceae bacterium]|nr:polysaccharide biosynthesis/export family protein [Pyrinomonadaceae bacterium]